MGAGSQQTKGLEYVTRSFYSSICLLPPARGRHCESYSITVPRAAKGPALEQGHGSTGRSSQKPQVPSRGHGWLLLGAEVTGRRPGALCVAGGLAQHIPLGAGALKCLRPNCLAWPLVSHKLLGPDVASSFGVFVCFSFLMLRLFLVCKALRLRSKAWGKSQQLLPFRLQIKLRGYFHSNVKLHFDCIEKTVSC